MQRIAVTDICVMGRSTQGVREYGTIGLILALGEVVYNDTNRTFQQWHEELKGGLSKNTQDRRKTKCYSKSEEMIKISLNLLMKKLNN